MFLLAYFDPGSASLLMQALVGGGAGLAVFGRYLWSSVMSRGSHARLAAPAAEPVVRSPVVRNLGSDGSLVEALSGEFRFNLT